MNSRDSLRKAIHRPGYLLWLLREKTIESFDQLFDQFDAHRDDASVYLRRSMETLKAAGLVEFDAYPFHEHGGRIGVTEVCSRVLDALDVSLSELAARTDNTMTVEPAFKCPVPGGRRVDVFVLMPFTAAMEPVYNDHVKKVCGAVGVSVARADDFFSTNEVIADIWTAISQSRIVIADCSGRNPNVFYELGIAHTLGKPVILTTQSEQDIPFDIRHRRYLAYEFTPRGMRLFEDSLSATLRALLEEDSQTSRRGRHG